MRWRSRLALGAAFLLPTAGLAAPAEARTSSPTRHDGVGRTVSAHRSTESAVVTAEPSSGRQSQSLRPVLGDLPTGSELPPATWVFVAFVAAITFSARPRVAARGRAPPLRFL
jgi:hypothetical protein